MIDRDEAEAALVAVQELVAADGGDILLIDIAADSVGLQLVLESAECAECVMPRQFLETVALDMMARAVTGLVAVRVDDPRERD